MKKLDANKDIDLGPADRWEDEFLTYSMLRDKYHLPDVTQQQYLPLPHLLTILFGPAAFTTPETPAILNQLAKSFKTKIKRIPLFIHIFYQ